MNRPSAPSLWESFRGFAVDVILVWWGALKALTLLSLGALAGWCWLCLAFMLSFTERDAWLATGLLVLLGMALGHGGLWVLVGGFLGVFLASNTTGIEATASAYTQLLLAGAAGAALARWRRRARGPSAVR